MIIRPIPKNIERVIIMTSEEEWGMEIAEEIDSMLDYDLSINSGGDDNMGILFW